MMKFLALATHALALLPPSVSATCHPTPVEVDVAIIGGGSSGIHAAIQLKDAGAKVLVIEKKHQIGGHAETYVNPQTGQFANAGVVFFENREVVHSYFSRLNVPTTQYNALYPQPGTPETKAYDFSLGIAIPAQNASSAAAAQEAIMAAAQSYSDNVLSKYPWVDQGYFVPDPVPEDLTLPFGKLAEKYNFTALMPIIGQFAWYMGNMTSLPSLYGIKWFGPGLLASVFGNFTVAASGNTRSLYEAAAKDLGGSVLLNATVVSVHRNEKTNVSVLVQQPGQAPTLVHARKLLIAIPPTMENVGAFDLSEDERSILSKFSGLGYWAGIATIPGLNNDLENVGVQQPFNQPVIPGTIGFDAVGSGPEDFLFGVGFNTPNYTDADGEAVIRESLAKLGTVGAVPSNASETVKFAYTTNHVPFDLQVSSEEIESGFYRELLALEGARNTYWAGAAFAGQNSALIWSFNEGTVLPGLKKDLGL
jgi:hypothetical protein